VIILDSNKKIDDVVVIDIDIVNTEANLEVHFPERSSPKKKSYQNQPFLKSKPQSLQSDIDDQDYNQDYKKERGHP